MSKNTTQTNTTLYYDPVFLQNGNLNRLSNLGIKKYFLKKNILNQLYQRGSMSNPELCKVTNMSSPSISKLLTELMNDKLVREEGIGHSIGGRKPNLYGLIPDARFNIGIKIGQESSDVAVFNIRNEIIGKVRTLSRKMESSDAFVDDIYHFASSVINNTGIDNSKILGIGIGLPGLVDPVKGKNYSYLNHSRYSTRELFERRFKKPVFINNDARVMALGEYAFGLAKGKKNVLCLTVSAGIGMGMILNGNLYYGNSGFAGEFGHIRVVEDGLLCHCGKRGCLETVASGLTLERMAREQVALGKVTNLLSLVDGDIEKITAGLVIKSALSGDQFCIDLLSVIGENLGKGLSILIHLFNPEAIIIGGEMAKADQYIIDPVKQALNKYTMAHIRNDTVILVSKLLEKAAVLGASALVMENIFMDVKNTAFPV
jgi:glucokinase-like ROK family protein